MLNDHRQLSRRRFLRAFASAPIASGPGSWVIRPDWANAVEGPIRIGSATDLTGALGFAGNTDANVARMVVNEIKRLVVCWGAPSSS
ncbi:branched-chain amino acid transport system substrate-binding protein [Bradyrhizobium shewense]|uniref:Branched-chain amino acid transport system substrate-binding protein n=1 Tax=Bradyrhizobium shewense TaxID=1761772 RepID=A0A1C3XIV0_9BRAD|nr:branched-chain amino acid transport system substrate-binding protein [Bradyrhizobium shewense]